MPIKKHDNINKIESNFSCNVRCANSKKDGYTK